MTVPVRIHAWLDNPAVPAPCLQPSWQAPECFETVGAQTYWSLEVSHFSQGLRAAGWGALAGQRGVAGRSGSPGRGRQRGLSSHGGPVQLPHP